MTEPKTRSCLMSFTFAKKVSGTFSAAFPERYSPDRRAEKVPDTFFMAVAGLLLLGVIGCGSKLYPARGTVTYPDGSPVTEGLVVFESKDQEKTTTARGEIRSDGSFELGTFKPGDGARPGKYCVLVAPKFDPNAVDRPSKKPTFHSRYGEFKTAELAFDVTAAGPNEFPIKVTRRIPYEA